MSGYRDCFDIDVVEMECDEGIQKLTPSQAGKIIRRINREYIAGNFEFLKQFRWIKKIYPHSSPGVVRRRIPEFIRREVLSSGPCVRCGSFDRLSIDHIIPVSKGGSDRRQNLQPMCLPCNIRKGNRL